MIKRTLLLGSAFGLREKPAIVNLKPNLQSLIEVKVLSPKELLFKTETIDKCMENFRPQDYSRDTHVTKSSFWADAYEHEHAFVGWRLWCGKKIIIVSLKANLQSLIDLKVLSTKGLLFKTETIHTWDNITWNTFVQFTGSFLKAKKKKNFSGH